ncbi:MAG: sialidase family protein, partial [Verrucomicrobiota bacterium]
MIRALAFVALFAVAAHAAHAAEPAIVAEEIAPPAGATAGSSTITMSPEGTAWLTWLETAEDKAVSLRFSTFDVAAKRWSAARTIARSADLHAGASDVPTLTVGKAGRATALWYIKNPPSPATAHLHHGAGYHAVTSSTRDGGATWSAPAR